LTRYPIGEDPEAEAVQLRPTVVLVALLAVSPVGAAGAMAAVVALVLADVLLP
jgi:hypothetical protein